MMLNILQCTGQSFTTNIMAPNGNSAEDKGNPSLGVKTKTEQQQQKKKTVHEISFAL